MEPTPDVLVATMDLCSETLAGLASADWSAPAANTEWTCRHTLVHLCSLAFSHQLTTRATSFRPIAVDVRPDAPIGDLVWTMRVLMLVLADVARAAPPNTRAFHPAGMADPSGWVAMGMDELLVHTRDIASGLGAEFVPPAELVRATLDRLFPWWPRDAEPWLALQWANGRASMPGHPSQGAKWLWHCAPREEWDGTIPQWDPVASRVGASIPRVGWATN